MNAISRLECPRIAFIRKSLGCAASPGLWIKTDIMGRILSVGMEAPTNGLGMIWRVQFDHSIRRVTGL